MKKDEEKGAWDTPAVSHRQISAFSVEEDSRIRQTNPGQVDERIRVAQGGDDPALRPLCSDRARHQFGFRECVSRYILSWVVGGLESKFVTGDSSGRFSLCSLWAFGESECLTQVAKPNINRPYDTTRKTFIRE